MFNIGKVMSSFNNVQSGMFSDILKRAVPSLTKAIDTRGLLDGLSKLLGGGAAGAPAGIAQQIAQSIAGGAAGKPALLPAGSLDGLADALTKAMYISVLLEAVEDAREKKHFNVETAINDLWIKLAKVRPKQNLQMGQQLQLITSILKQQNDMAKGIIQNMR